MSKAGFFVVPPPTPDPKTSDPTLDKLLRALDAPPDDPIAEQAESKLVAHDPDAAFERQLRERFEQVIAGVGPTNMHAELHDRMTPEQADAAHRQSYEITQIAGQLEAHVERLARVMVAQRSEALDLVLAKQFERAPSVHVRHAIGNALLGGGAGTYTDEARRAHEAAIRIVANAIELPTRGYTYDYALRALGAHAVAMLEPGGGFDRMSKYASLEEAELDEYTASAILGALIQHVPPTEIDPRWLTHLAPLYAHRHGPGVTVPYFYRKFLDFRTSLDGVGDVIGGLCDALDLLVKREGGDFGALIGTLADHGDERAVAAILRALRAVPYGWDAGLTALGKLAGPEILPELEKLQAAITKKPHKYKKPSVLKKLIASLKAKEKEAQKATAKASPRANASEPAKTKPPRPAPPKPTANAPKSAKATKPRAPGVPDWTAPPKLPVPATSDASLDQLLVDLESQTPREFERAMAALAERGDRDTTRHLVARLVAAAEDVCHFAWEHELFAKLKGPAAAQYRKVHNSLERPIQARVSLAHRLAWLLAPRHDPEAERVMLELHRSHPNHNIQLVVALAMIGRRPPHDLRQSADRTKLASPAALDAIASRVSETRSAVATEALFLVDPDHAFDRLHPLFEPTPAEHTVDDVLHVVVTHTDEHTDRRWVGVALAMIERWELPMQALLLVQRLPDRRAVDPILRYIDRALAADYPDPTAAETLAIIGDPRGVDGILKIIAHPSLTSQFAGVVHDLRRLATATDVPAIEALAETIAKANAKSKTKSSWRDPKLLREVATHAAATQRLQA